jgi:hypothetical protein
MTMLEDYHLVVMTAPAAIAITMLAEFGAMLAKFAAVFAEFATRMIPVATDDDVLSTRNRWGRDGEHAKGCNNVSKFLHAVLLG